MSMTNKEFEIFQKKMIEPVNKDKVHESIQRFIDGKYCRMCVPVSPDDDDMILARTIRELERYREKFGIVDWSEE